MAAANQSCISTASWSMAGPFWYAMIVNILTSISGPAMAQLGHGPFYQLHNGSAFLGIWTGHRITKREYRAQQYAVAVVRLTADAWRD